MSAHSNQGGLPPEEVLDDSIEEIFESAPCGYLSTQCDGRIIRVNRTLSEWIGLDGQQLKGKRLLDLLTPGCKIYYETHFAPLLRMHGHVDEIALDLVCNGGRVVPTLVSARQKLNSAGEPILNRLTVFNASERRIYERELLLARRRAEEAAADSARANEELSRTNAALLRVNDQLAEFTYAASHDLQEPLRTISLYAQLLAKDDRTLSESTKTYLSYILDGAARMRMLIADLLSFSRAQGSDPVLRATDMEAVLNVVLANLNAAIEETGATISHDPLPTVDVNAGGMVQVFQNLISNAIKYAKPGEAPSLHISANRENSAAWCFTVEDHGLGFDIGYAEQIFGLFKRLHGRDIPGTGVGLAICRKIVESHGGRIWATSTPGIGSRFSFTIPDRNLA